MSSLPVLALLALTAAQTGKLDLANVRPTLGLYGPPRADLRYNPGDLVHLAFDIGGLQADDKGRLLYGTALTVEDPKGVVVLKEGMTEAPPVVNVLGGGKVPHSVLVSTGVDQPVGTYKVKVTVADFQGKKEASFTKEFILLPPEFGIVRFQLSYDRAAQFPSGPAAALGQTVFVNFVLLGYKRDARNEGAAAVELSVQDAAGKPANLQPLTGEFKPITTANPFLQIRFDLPLHRAGQYKLILKATDHVAKKTVTLAVPFQVVEPR